MFLSSKILILVVRHAHNTTHRPRVDISIHAHHSSRSVIGWRLPVSFTAEKFLRKTAGLIKLPLIYAADFNQDFNRDC